jgi:small subunit ribosomal protein S27Ae
LAKAPVAAKARVGLYSTKGDTLTRTHKFCPKCGSGTFLAEHSNRRSCGKCGYSESKAAPTTPPMEKAKQPAKGPKPPAAAAPSVVPPR